MVAVHVAEEVGELGSGSQPVFGAASAIRPDSVRRASALGFMRRLLAMDVVHADFFMTMR